MRPAVLVALAALEPLVACSAAPGREELRDRVGAILEAELLPEPGPGAAAVVLHWSMQYALNQIQQAFDGLFENLEVPVLRRLISVPLAFWSRLNSLAAAPSDALGSQVAKALQRPGQQRERLTGGIYLPRDHDRGLGRLEHAFSLSFQADAIVRVIKRAIRAGTLPSLPLQQVIEPALRNGVISREEVDLLRDAEMARQDAIQVDSFTLEEYMRTAVVDEMPDGKSGVPARMDNFIAP